MAHDPDRLRADAMDHLWLHFARIGDLDPATVPVIARGEGCLVWDVDGREYLDALAGLFVVQVGHGRAELAIAAAAQLRELAYHPIWGRAHPPAIELAAELARLAPGDLNRVFFTSGGSEAVDSAWKLAIAHFRATGRPEKQKVIARRNAYHGMTFGAMSITGLPAYQEGFPLVPGVSHVENTNAFRHELAGDPEAFSAWCADQLAEELERQGPETVAAVFLEPLQNAGGCIPPPPGYFQRVRELCDTHDVLLVSDEVIAAFGRLGHLFGCERYGYLPDIVTTAKGLTSGYAPLGAVIASDRVAEPFLRPGSSFGHGLTFGGHPMSCAVGLANLAILQREDLCDRVRTHEADLEASLRRLSDIPVVADVRGAGYFWAIELVRDAATDDRLTDPDERATIVRLVARRMEEEGLIARAVDRGDPHVQVSPPLTAGPDEFARVEATLRTVLTEAADHAAG